jgi:hypothetical protein
LLNKIISNIIGKHGGDARQICDDHALFDSDVWRSFIWDIIMEHANLLYGESGELHPPEGRIIFMDDFTHNIPRDRPSAVEYYSSDDLRSAWIAGRGEFSWSNNWEIDKWEWIRTSARRSGALPRYAYPDLLIEARNRYLEGIDAQGMPMFQGRNFGDGTAASLLEFRHAHGHWNFDEPFNDDEVMICKEFMKLKVPRLATRSILTPAPKGFARVLETGAPAIEDQIEDSDARHYVRNSKSGVKPKSSSKPKAQDTKQRETKRKDTRPREEPQLSMSSAEAAAVDALRLQRPELSNHQALSIIRKPAPYTGRSAASVPAVTRQTAAAVGKSNPIQMKPTSDTDSLNRQDLQMAQRVIDLSNRVNAQNSDVAALRTAQENMENLLTDNAQGIATIDNSISRLQKNWEAANGEASTLAKRYRV